MRQSTVADYAVCQYHIHINHTTLICETHWLTVAKAAPIFQLKNNNFSSKVEFVLFVMETLQK